MNSVVCQFAPSPRYWPISSRLQLNPLNPLARSAAGTCPCNPTSGLSLGPHVALGTDNGVATSPGFPFPPAPTSATHANASSPACTGRDMSQRFMELLLSKNVDPCSGTLSP